MRQFENTLAQNCRTSRDLHPRQLRQLLPLSIERGNCRTGASGCTTVANGIDAEVSRLRAEAKKSMEAEAVRLRALARREAEIIERAAQAEIAAAQRAASLELKSLAARLAVERAQAVLAREITPEAQAVLFNSFVLELERGAN